ncbi:hypothetical protein ACERII_13940 [Evansella sp. AB-rgal1]|uniref:hypothetical protein n=1 Tax=Evansella sp. AB-rgal1 TaxID=3242696 RepID=UPI00359E46F1
MKKKVSRLLTAFLVTFCFILGFSQLGYASDFQTQAIPGNPVYPGTNIKMKAGDVLYSSKGLDTYLVGHVGIVDANGQVIHMMKNGGMKRESISAYSSNFKYTIYQAKVENNGYKAAQNATSLYNNYRSSASYTLTTTLTRPKDKQYCTKLVWQAYYYGSNINLGDNSFT